MLAAPMAGGKRDDPGSRFEMYPAVPTPVPAVAVASTSTDLHASEPGTYAARFYEGSVWIFFNDQPFGKWGIGPEGREQALKNCKHACATRSHEELRLKYGPK